MFGRRLTPTARQSLLMFHIDRPKARISSSLVLTGYITVVLSLWLRDRNRMDSGESDDTWWYRTPSFFMGMQGVTRCCHGSLAPLAMGDSGTSTVLTRYESMRLWSLRQSEWTTVRSRYNTKYELIHAIGCQYETSTKMDALMLYDGFQTFG